MSSATVIPQSWREWLLHNRDRGCAREQLVDRALAQGFSKTAIEQILDEPAGTTDQKLNELTVDWLAWFEASLTRPDHRPRAWRLDTALAQIYEIPNLLSRSECDCVIEAINGALQPSTVTRGSSDYRTSRTCHLRENQPDLAADLDQRFAALLGVDPRLSEPIQGQRYDPGEYFKEHTDWFTPGTEEYIAHTRVGGQRTWTVMIYLNAVELGGETCFRRLDRCFTPTPGLALIWNNLQADGTPNPFTLHEAVPVAKGNKWVITKWFRSQFGRNEATIE
mgnify:FL=1